MIARLYRALVMGLAPIALIACVNSAPNAAGEGAVVPLGVDLGGSGPVAAAAPPAADQPPPRGKRAKSRWRMPPAAMPTAAAP